MKISILLLLIGSILSSSDYDEQYYHFYDITFNERYYVDMAKYEYGFLPAGHNYYFRLGVIPNDKMEIQCTVQRYAVTAFKVDVCPFYTKPSNNEVYHGNNLCANALQGVKSEYESYDRYTYPFTTGENVNYLAVHLETILPECFPLVLYSTPIDTPSPPIVSNSQPNSFKVIFNQQMNTNSSQIFS